jgi:hypothetical protein
MVSMIVYLLLMLCLLYWICIIIGFAMEIILRLLMYALAGFLTVGVVFGLYYITASAAKTYSANLEWFWSLCGR